MFNINKDVELLWRYENMKTNRKLFEKIVKTATDVDVKVAIGNVNWHVVLCYTNLKFQ